MNMISGLRQSTVVLAAGVGLFLAASQAQAVIVWSGNVNLAIPATTNGLYLNVLTGANNLPGGTGGATVPGWDINPWGTPGLGFFNPTTPAGGVYVLSAAATAANLAVGTSISGASTFGAGSTANVAQWTLNSSNNYFGFRFLNEGGGTVHYGWARLAFGATVAERSLVSYAFESSPLTAIPAGVIPEPGTYALMGLGLAGLLFAVRRRKQA